MLQDLAVQTLNVSLMFSVGAELAPTELRAAARKRSVLLGAMAINFGLLPLLALLATRLIPIPDAIAAGILLSMFAPGGGTGTLLTRAALGSLELSVVMLGLLTLLAVPLTPALTFATLSPPGQVPLQLGVMVQTLALFQLLPLCIGAALRRAHAPWAARVNAVARPGSNLLFGGLVVGLLVTRGHLIAEVGGLALATIATLVLVSFAIPWAGTQPASHRTALSLTTGVRNLSLALLLSSTFFSDLTTVTVLTYGLLMYLVGIPWAIRLRATNRRVPARPPGPAPRKSKTM